MNAAKPPPVPGVAPIMTPIREPMPIGLRHRRYSSFVILSLVMAEELIVLWSVLGSYWDFIIISEIANSPMRAMIRSIPLMSRLLPKVKRAVPLILSMPMVAMNKPMQAPISPLKILLLETPAITDSPKTAKAKYSAGPNSSVIFAIWGARNSRANALIRPPMVDAYSAICSALNACPLWVMG